MAKFGNFQQTPRDIMMSAALLLGAIASPFPLPTKTIAPGVEMPVLMIGTGRSHAYEVEPIVKGWMALGGRGIESRSWRGPLRRRSPASASTRGW